MDEDFYDKLGWVRRRRSAKKRLRKPIQSFYEPHEKEEDYEVAKSIKSCRGGEVGEDESTSLGTGCGIGKT